MIKRGCSLAAEVHAIKVKIDIETQEALVLHLAILSDHQNILLRNQVIDAVCDFLCCLGSFFD